MPGYELINSLEKALTEIFEQGSIFLRMVLIKLEKISCERIRKFV